MADDAATGGTPTEPHTTRLARLRMRSWRRGTREMDLILGPFSDAILSELAPAELDAFEALLSENDQDLYRWVGSPASAPSAHAAMLGRIRAQRGLS